MIEVVSLVKYVVTFTPDDVFHKHICFVFVLFLLDLACHASEHSLFLRGVMWFHLWVTTHGLILLFCDHLVELVKLLVAT